jgi:ribosomal protein L37E
MPPPSDASPRKRRPSRRWVLGWLGVFLGCAGLWGCEAILYHDDWAEKRERKSRTDELTALLDSYLKQPAALCEKLESDLNGGRPFEPSFNYRGVGIRYTCKYWWHAGALGPRFAGWGVEFVFGRPASSDLIPRTLMSYKITAPLARPGTSFSAARAEMETTRNIALLLGGGAWFVGMVTMFFARPWRRQVAQVCLAGVVVAAVAWSVSPTRDWQRASFVAPLPIGIASAGLLSLLALIIPVGRSGPGTSAPRCADCGYDLTGNQSGICPECGRPTLRRRADRWQEQADRLSAVTDEQQHGGGGQSTPLPDFCTEGISPEELTPFPEYPHQYPQRMRNVCLVPSPGTPGESG